MWETRGRTLALISALVFCAVATARAQDRVETIWIEAEHLDGIRGYCWPMARGQSQRHERMRTTDGHWGLSGPGWAAEWNQGGESAFLSIACGAGDDRAVATKTIEVPADGLYRLWVRYRDNRGVSERFVITVQQPGAKAWSATWGQQPVLEANNVMKLYWDGAFGWDVREVRLRKGKAKLWLRSAVKEPHCRQLDCIVLTTDRTYRPWIKERPRNYTWQLLDRFRNGPPADLEPLARRTGDWSVPEQWRPRTFKPGFLYLWNTQLTETTVETETGKGGRGQQRRVKRPASWLRQDPEGILYPFNAYGKVREALVQKYAGRRDLPIFSDPRIVPIFHGPGPAALGLQTTRKPETPPTAEEQAAEAFRKWLQAEPRRMFGSLLNYQPNKPLSEAAKRLFFDKLGDRYVGGVSGENLGYFGYDRKALEEAASRVSSRRELVAVMGRIYMEGNRTKYAAVFGDDVKKLENPYTLTIPCQSVSGISFYPLCYHWGARTVGYESTAATAAMLGMRAAFLRGAARQFGGRTGVYRSCNFGDSSTIFSGETHWYTKPQNIFDNYYSVYSGAGMTWYKFDIWYQYMAGAAMFYHEQGFDEFWRPGGLTAAGQWEVQLSPKGKLVDHFLRTTAPDQDFDRGVPFTPAAVLVDYAHGWDPSHYQPRHWGSHTVDGPATKLNIHDDAMQGLFWTLYHPIGPVSQEPITGVNETYLHGIFGDIFDVVYSAPDSVKAPDLRPYRVLIVGGDIELTRAEGERLKSYVENGGTLVVARGQLHGEGAAALTLPPDGKLKEADTYLWRDQAAAPAQRFRYRPIEGGAALAKTPDGDVFCASFDRAKGRLIYLSVPYGLGIDRQPIPPLALLATHATRRLMPIEVHGDVEWSLNRNGRGWMLTLINAAGQPKPQQGIWPTDYRQNRIVHIRAAVPIKTAVDRLQPTDPFDVRDNAFECIVPAGTVRIIEIR